MKKKLTQSETVLVGVTLFGMFFGAGNLIFPVHLGQIAGCNSPAAVAGFLLTAVCLPILGVAAIGNTHSDSLLALADRVGHRYSVIFTTTLYLVLSPLVSIPRCATTSFSSAVEPYVKERPGIALLLFTACFFTVLLVLSLNAAKLMDYVGKIITPVFLVLLTLLLAVSLIRSGTPVASVEPVETYREGAFLSGFMEGYNTMDAVAALAFGVVVVDIIKRLGVSEDRDVAKNIIRSGVLTAVLMAGIYVASVLMGAKSRGLFEISDNGATAFAQLANTYLGKTGGILLGITITLACLKTSIGLMVSSAEMFAEMYPRLLTYRQWVILFTVFCFALSNVGLNTIISWSVPVLMLLYPLCMVLIVLALFEDLFGGSRAVYVCTTAGAGLAAVFDFLKTLPVPIEVPAVTRFLPFFDLGFGWLLPALLGLLLGLLLAKQEIR